MGQHMSANRPSRSFSPLELNTGQIISMFGELMLLPAMGINEMILTFKCH